jgi:adenine/guanine phosphoribosyltransferase-like PRPP-binding protein
MSIIAKTIKYTIVATATVTGIAIGATLSLVAGTYIVTRNARRILDETGHFENDYVVVDKKVNGQSWSFSMRNKD